MKDGKSAIVRPLMKSLQKDAIKINYRPVSNLFFISKIVDKFILEQCMQHCSDWAHYHYINLHIRNFIAANLAW